MPLGPFRRKKKKKDLPKPPSFSKEDDSPFAGPPRELLKPPQVKRPSPPEALSELTGPPRESKFTEKPKPSELLTPPRIERPSPPEALSELTGPPRESKFTEPPKTSDLMEPPRVRTSFAKEVSSELSGPPRETPIFEGPPRQSPTRDTSVHPKLPRPPPFSSEQSREPVPLFEDGAITNEIHAELRKRKFGSDMEKTPKRKAASIPTDELTKRHFRETRQNYIEAGNKHLELNFYDNAATNYACAIFCDLIVEGWEAARRTMSELSTGTPSSITDNNIFDSTRLTIEAIRTKNFNFLSRAERTIQSNTEHLYPEDIAIIEKALKAAKAELGYE
ncbi:MAG: hypothetical protein ACFE95_14515 [Candidatus Hodarchaeota archaeon]